jgi:hypothetical protein
MKTEYSSMVASNALPAMQGPEPAIRGIAWRLFLTCWLVYSLHVATNTVREIYPALSIADRFSFRVDEYANLHPDIFETPGYGWHINSNPGASMLAAVPYSIFAPIVNRIVSEVALGRKGKESPSYDSPWPMAREFYRESWVRGYDVKFGLASIITQAFCMAPMSALSVVAMYRLLQSLLGIAQPALWLALLYGFGTPVFFRTGYLNQNLLVTHCAVFGLLALVSSRERPSTVRIVAAGVAAGAAILFDYSGVVVFGALFCYTLLFGGRFEHRSILSRTLAFSAGAIPPIALLWFYQWCSFGNPFLPAQHWMPRIAFTNVGFNGIGLPSGPLAVANLFDYRFGLVVSSPILLCALAQPFVQSDKLRLKTSRALFFAGAAAGVWLFSSSVGYAWLQFNTGVRYLLPAVPFVFPALAVTLLRLPTRLRYVLVVGALTQSWAMAMYRDVERGFGVLDSLLHLFVGGFQLPFLSTLSRMGTQYGDYAARGVSPMALFALSAALIWIIWSVAPSRSTNGDHYE